MCQKTGDLVECLNSENSVFEDPVSTPYKSNAADGVGLSNRRLIPTILSTRYPSSAIAPPLPYLFSHDRFCKVSTTPLLPGLKTSQNEGLEEANAFKSESFDGDDKKEEIEHNSQHGFLPVKPLEPMPSPPSLGYKNSLPLSLEEPKAQQADTQHPPQFRLLFFRGKRDRSLHEQPSGKQEICRLVESLPPQFSFASGAKTNVTGFESLASDLPEPEWDLPNFYRHLRKLSSLFPTEFLKEDSHRSTCPHDDKRFIKTCSCCFENKHDYIKSQYERKTSLHFVKSLTHQGYHPSALTSVELSKSRGSPVKSDANCEASPNLNLQHSHSTSHTDIDPCLSPQLGIETKPTENTTGLESCCSAASSSAVSNQQFPSRLLLVTRRFPHKIIPVFRPTSLSAKHSFLARSASNSLTGNGANLNATSGINLDGAVAGNPTQHQYHLTMQEAQAVSWVIERNQFGIDLAEAFSDQLCRVVVTDPGVTFSLLSDDADVQRSLRRSLRDFLLENNIIPVFLDASGTAGSERYSEEVLAPLFHYITPPVSTGYHNLDWTGYRELNISFLNSIVEHYVEGDWILVINYQLMLLPKMLRERPITRNVHIGFYLSTLFPSSEMYRMLPQREELLRGVLAASFIGFHSFQYKRHFFTACTRVLGVECSWDCIEPDPAVGNGAGARVVTIPRGINPHPWLAELQKPSNHAKISELRERLKGRKVLLGVDTLDYTKGIPNKILAFNKFLVNHPEWASNVVFYQICVPKRQRGWSKDPTGFSRTGRYFRGQGRDILSTVYHLVGSINANFGNLLHQPIHFLLSPLSVENLVCLYGLADIVVITPLRESLSWTAYEFVLCQSYTNKGVLILSEFSGSAQSLGAAAICVNPWDADALAVAIHDALVMKDEEKLERHQYGVEYVLNYDSQAWGRNLFEEFCEAVKVVEAGKRTIPRAFPYFELIPQAFPVSTHRILILGMRGTLYPSSYRGMDPQFAGRIRLSRMMDAALDVLSQDPNTHILVISSSPVSVLQETLGHLTNITLVAENGHLQRLSHRLHKLSKVEAKCSKSLASMQRDNNTVTSHTPKSYQECKTPNNTLFLPRQSENTTPQFEYTTSDIDLSWMEPVLESCCYFEQRTPGSFLVRTATSIGWNYHGAQREHGTRQARDLLIHLWARPATVAARTDIVLGPHSVEIRSAAMSKAAAIERWFSMVLTLCVNKDVSQCMVLCASNFLPCDEAVFSTINKELSQNCPGNVSRDAPLSATCGSILQNRLVLAHDTDATKQRMNHTTCLDHGCVTDTLEHHPEPLKDRVWMCTVGVKPSRADYSIKDDKEVERLLTLLAALVVMQPNGIGMKMFHTSSIEDTAEQGERKYGIGEDLPLLAPYPRSFNFDVLSELNCVLSKPKRRLLLTQLNTSSVCSNHDIQKALVLAAHYYYLPSHSFHISSDTLPFSNGTSALVNSDLPSHRPIPKSSTPYPLYATQSHIASNSTLIQRLPKLIRYGSAPAETANISSSIHFPSDDPNDTAVNTEGDLTSSNSSDAESLYKDNEHSNKKN